MGKVESAIKAEISRLARREARQLLAKSVAEVRRLNRKVGQFARELRALKGGLAQTNTLTRFRQASEAVATEEADRGRLSPGLIKKLRGKLKITQPEFARLLGVSISAVGFWESGKVRPRPQMRAKIIGLRTMGRRDVRRLLLDQAAATKRKPAAAKRRAVRKGGRRKKG